MSRVVVATDHAVLRYMERVLGFDFEPFRDQIKAVVASAAMTGASRITTDGFVYHLAHEPGKAFVTTVHVDLPTHPKKVAKGVSRKNGERPEWCVPAAQRNRIKQRKSGRR